MRLGVSKLFSQISSRQVAIIYAILSSISVLVYIGLGCFSYRCGYPLDDAWIHQTYARNLVEYREWSFIPGNPSAGSTSPMWTIILALGYGLRINPMLWTFFLGFVLLFLLSCLFYWVFRILFPDLPLLALWGGMLVIFEWHFVWAAASGMETLFCTLLYTFVILLLPLQPRSWLLAGVLVGLYCWVRPDAITLMLPCSIVMISRGEKWTIRFSMFSKFILGIAITIIPYFLFNFAIGHVWLPATYFAKQAEYAEMRLTPFVRRFIEQASLPMVGVGILLFPGFCYQAVKIIQKRDWYALSGLIWMLFFILLYTFRLPVTYQHGRYLIPVFPIYIFWGMVGVYHLDQLLNDHWKNIIKLTWSYSLVAVLLCFWIIGGKAYGRDVAFIESEMVDMAYWISNNTAPTSKIAVHDIGAVGYFSHRSLIDLAGLINPEVIPFLRNETLLAQYINEQNADYLVVFREWYPLLTSNRKVLHSSGNQITQLQISDHLSIYPWHSP
jgi:hypothetical protein